MTTKGGLDIRVLDPILKHGRWILFIWVMLNTTYSVQAQSNIFTSLRDDYNLDAELYLYASTLRMVNIAKNPGFNEMVKDIERMKFFKIGDFGNKDIKSLVSRFKEEEDFEELMTVDGKGETLYILGDDRDQFIGLVKSDGDLIAINLKGMIGVHKIPELIESFDSDNFLDVFEIGRSERQEHQRERIRN